MENYSCHDNCCHKECCGKVSVPSIEDIMSDNVRSYECNQYMPNIIAVDVARPTEKKQYTYKSYKDFDGYDWSELIEYWEYNWKVKLPDRCKIDWDNLLEYEDKPCPINPRTGKEYSCYECEEERLKETIIPFINSMGGMRAHPTEDFMDYKNWLTEDIREYLKALYKASNYNYYKPIWKQLIKLSYKCEHTFISCVIALWSHMWS